MRDTYADTSLARKDLGFAPRVSLEEGIEAEYRWLSKAGGRRDSPARTWQVYSCSRDAMVLAVAGRRGACASGAEEAAHRHARARQVPVRARQEALERSAGSSAREYFRQLMDSYPQSQFRAGRQAGHGRYLHRRGLDRIIRAGDQRVPGVPQVLPDATDARLRAVSSWRWRTSTRCAPRCGIRPRPARPSASWIVFMERFPSSALREEATAKLRDARDRLRTRSIRWDVHYYRQKWYPGAIERFKGICRARPRFHASRRGVLLSGRSARTDPAPGGGASLLRSAAQGIRRRASIWRPEAATKRVES